MRKQLGKSLEESFKNLTVLRKQMLQDLSLYTNGLEAKTKPIGGINAELAFTCRSTMDMVKSVVDDMSWRTEILAAKADGQEKLVDAITDNMGIIVYGIAAIAEVLKEVKADNEEVKKLKQEITRIKPVAEKIDQAISKRTAEVKKQEQEAKEKQEEVKRQRKQFQDHVQ